MLFLNLLHILFPPVFFLRLLQQYCTTLTPDWLWDRTVWMKVWIKAAWWNPKDGHRTGMESRWTAEKTAHQTGGCFKLMYWKHTSECFALRCKRYSLNWVSFFYSLLKPDQNDDLLQRRVFPPLICSLASSSPSGSRFSLRALVVYF